MRGFFVGGGEILLICNLKGSIYFSIRFEWYVYFTNYLLPSSLIIAKGVDNAEDGDDDCGGGGGKKKGVQKSKKRRKRNWWVRQRKR